jgi:hypothetical protein
MSEPTGAADAELPTPPAPPPDAAPSQAPLMPLQRQRRSWLNTICYVLAPALACVVVLYFFAPRFYLWRGLTLGIPELYSAPEINRAREVLTQLDDPRVVITSSTNRVIYWRPFFPAIAHYLHLPQRVFLALPFLGCLAAAAVVYAVLAREFPLRRQAFYGTVSACAASWFFVSTGWLTYNDSWIVFALLGTVFARSRVLLLCCCLAAPWIEERFVVLLPTCLALRSLVTVDKQIGFRRVAVDVAFAVVGVTPYLIVRVTAYLNGTDPVFTDYVKEHVGQIYPLLRYVEGAWAGLRANWIYVVLWGWLAWSYRPRWYVAAAQLGMIASLVAVLKMAGDLHRSTSSFIPLAVAGMVLFQRRWPAQSVRLLPLVGALNLALPASLVITVF